MLICYFSSTTVVSRVNSVEIRSLSSEVAKTKDTKFRKTFGQHFVDDVLTICFGIISATVRKPNEVTRSNLTDFGQYVAECLPKYVQKVQLTAGDELEVLISPDGVIPTLQFLKDHHSAQFASLADIAGMDVPHRKYRFEVS